MAVLGFNSIGTSGSFIQSNRVLTYRFVTDAIGGDIVSMHQACTASGNNKMMVHEWFIEVSVPSGERIMAWGEKACINSDNNEILAAGLTVPTSLTLQPNKGYGVTRIGFAAIKFQLAAGPNISTSSIPAVYADMYGATVPPNGNFSVTTARYSIWAVYEPVPITGKTPIHLFQRVR